MEKSLFRLKQQKVAKKKL
jgi:dihydrolipoamide dehydrogenase